MSHFHKSIRIRISAVWCQQDTVAQWGDNNPETGLNFTIDTKFSGDRRSYLCFEKKLLKCMKPYDFSFCVFQVSFLKLNRYTHKFCFESVKDKLIEKQSDRVLVLGITCLFRVR